MLMSEDVHPIVAAMPRVRFVCQRDVLRYRGHEIGVLWDANPWPRLGELVYRKWLVLRFVLNFDFLVDRRA